MGTMPDRELAQKLGRTFTAVQARRIKLGIAPKDPKRKTWTADENALLGRIPDVEIAARLNLTRDGVAAHRRDLGVAPLEPTATSSALDSG